MCSFKTDDVSEGLAIAVLNNHGLAHQPPHPAAPSAAPPATPPAGVRGPQVDAGISTEDWNVFLRRWEVFRAGSGDAASAPAQLFQCAGGALGDRLLKSDSDAASRTLPELLQAMRALAVIPVTVSVLRTELLQLNQGRGEQFRSFAALVRGKAETCSFHTSCSCGRNVDYTDNVIRDVLLCGMSDLDIRREMLGTEDILEISVNDVIALVENKEIARNAFPLSAVSAASSFKRQGGSVVT